MTSFKERLISAEDTFLSALSQGGDALTAFDKSWESLMVEVDLAMDSNDLDPETTLLIQTTTSRIAMLADTSIELVGLHDTFRAQFMSQLDLLMSELTLVDHQSCAPSSSADILSTTPSTGDRDTYRRMPSLKRTRESDCLDSVSSKRPRCEFIGCTPRKTSTSRRLRPRSLSPGVSLPFSPTSPSTSPESNDAGLPFTNKRKRRLSESNASSSSPSSKRLYAGPRLHAVSDSFLPRAIAPITTTVSSDVSSVNGSINVPGNADPLDTTTDEAHISVHVDPLSQLPLPTDVFLDSFADSTWSQTSPSHDTDIDTLVQSICQIVDQSALQFYPSDTPFPTFATHGLDSPDTPGSDLSPASTPSYPLTPLLAPLCLPDFFDGVTTTHNIGLAPDTFVSGTNENCFTFQLPATPIPKVPLAPFAPVTDCSDSEAYWNFFLQPPEPFNLPCELSSLTLPKSIGASFDDIQFVVGTDV